MPLSLKYFRKQVELTRVPGLTDEQADTLAAKIHANYLRGREPAGAPRARTPLELRDEARALLDAADRQDGHMAAVLADLALAERAETPPTLATMPTEITAAELAARFESTKKTKHSIEKHHLETYEETVDDEDPDDDDDDDRDDEEEEDDKAARGKREESAALSRQRAFAQREIDARAGKRESFSLHSPRQASHAILTASVAYDGGLRFAIPSAPPRPESLTFDASGKRVYR